MKLEDEYIYMPDPEERRQLESAGLPQCCMFMDGTVIKLEDAPSRDKESYYCKDKVF